MNGSALVRPGQKNRSRRALILWRQDDLQAEVIARGNFGERRIGFAAAPDFFASDRPIGHVPLPPYIDRSDHPADRERYQTVYAREKGSVAAPTAGLHFTPEILARIKHRGIETTELTLHVGLGTFQPVREERVEDHKLHREAYSISIEAASALNRALETGRHIVAIGTTTVSRWNIPPRSGPGAGESGKADIFIYPEYEFKVVGAMLTNFHLPQSTLLMLVWAFGSQRESSLPTPMRSPSVTGFIRTEIACSSSSPGIY